MNNWDNGGRIKQLLICYIDGREVDHIKSFMKEEYNIFEQLRKQGVAVMAIPVGPGSETKVEHMPVHYEHQDPIEIASPGFISDDEGVVETKEITLEQLMNIEGLTMRFKENNNEE